MEQRIGAQMFERTRIHVRPTLASEESLRYARQIIEQTENMVRHI